jgi:tetratricopeptide (TPR) repeat protein
MTRVPLALFAFAMVIGTSIPAQQKSDPPNSSSPTDKQSGPAVTAVAAPAVGPVKKEEVRGDVQMAEKMYREAIGSYEQALAQEPKSAALLNKLGIAYQQEMDIRLATKYYKLSIKSDKKFVSAINNLGTVEYSKKHYGRAIRYYEQTLKLEDPQDVEATVYSNLGYAYFGAKEYDKAMGAFAKAMKLNPHVFEHHAGFGTVIQQRVTDDPGMLYFLLAKSYAVAGDAERCAHYLVMARDEGYKKLAPAVENDPAFSHVVRDHRVHDALHPQERAAADQKGSG